MQKAILTGLFVIAAAAVAHADPAIHVERHGGQRVYVLETPIEVRVHPPRPEVAILHAPASVDYVWHDLSEDLVGHITEALHHPPFERSR